MKKINRNLQYLGIVIGSRYVSFSFPSLTPLGSHGISPNPFQRNQATQSLNRLQKVTHTYTERFQRAVLTWDMKIQKIHSLSKDNLNSAIAYGDFLIQKDSSCGRQFREQEVHNVLGEILLKRDSVHSALQRYQMLGQGSRDLAMQALCYPKLKILPQRILYIKKLWQ